MPVAANKVAGWQSRSAFHVLAELSALRALPWGRCDKRRTLNSQGLMVKMI